MNETIKIAKDTKEWSGWNFNSFDDVEVIKQHVKIGDYELIDYPKGICIERKRNTGELAKNINEKRFVRELEKLKDYEKPFIICEFCYHDYDIYPENSGIPKNKWKELRSSGYVVKRKMESYELKYNIPILYFDDKYDAEEYVYKLFKEYIKEKENEEL